MCDKDFNDIMEEAQRNYTGWEIMVVFLRDKDKIEVLTNLDYIEFYNMLRTIKDNIEMQN